MARKKVTKISCDFCEKEIEKSTPTVTGTADPDNTGLHLGVEIRIFWPEGKRFTDDICKLCVLRFAIDAKRRLEVGTLAPIPEGEE